MRAQLASGYYSLVFRGLKSVKEKLLLEGVYSLYLVKLLNTWEPGTAEERAILKSRDLFVIIT